MYTFSFHKMIMTTVTPKPKWRERLLGIKPKPTQEPNWQRIAIQLEDDEAAILMKITNSLEITAEKRLLYKLLGHEVYHVQLEVGGLSTPYFKTTTKS